MRRRESPEEARAVSRSQPHEGNGNLQIAMTVLWNLPAEHRYFDAAQQIRTVHAIFVDFVRQLFATGHAESHEREEIRHACEQTDARGVMALGFGEQSFHER